MANDNDIFRGVDIPGLAISLADIDLGEHKEGETVITAHQLFPEKKLHHPFNDEPFKFDSKFRKGMIDSFKLSGLKVPIDFNHASMGGFMGTTSREDGAAAGWVTKLTSRGANGLEATIEWNEAGLEAIRNKTYQYLSPEFTTKKFNKETGEREDSPKLFAVALTNRPFLENQKTLAASDVDPNGEKEKQEVSTKELEELRAEMAALVDSRKEDQETIKSLNDNVVAMKAREDAATASLAVAKANQLTAAIEAAATAGKVTAANRVHIEKFAEVTNDVAALNEFLETLPVLVKKEREGISNPGKNKDKGGDFTSDDQAFFDRLDIDSGDVEKFGDLEGFAIGAGRVITKDGKHVKVAKFLKEAN